MPLFEIRAAERPRIEHDFTIRKNSGDPTAQEKEYFDALDFVIAEIAKLEEASKRIDGEDGSRISAITLDRIEHRKVAMSRLEQIAREFCSNGAGGGQAPDTSAGAASARKDTLLALEAYKHEYERALQTLFSVMYDRMPAGDKILLVKDLTILIVNRSGSGKPTPEQEKLYTAITETQAVIREVCHQLRDGTGPDSKWLAWFVGKATPDRASQLQDHFLRRLGGIGQVGLQLGHLNIASLALAALRDDFIMQQTGRIKNTYIRRLGLVSVASVLLCLLAYIGLALLAHFDVDPGSFAEPLAGFFPSLDRVRPFVLAAAGAAIGTWLSFSVRKVVLSFRELAVVEEDFVGPGARVAIVIGLTTVAVLMLSLHVVVLKVGDFETNRLGIGASLLVGLLCGLAERGIANAVSSRATIFAKSLGG